MIAVTLGSDDRLILFPWRRSRLHQLPPQRQHLPLGYRDVLCDLQNVPLTLAGRELRLLFADIANAGKPLLAILLQSRTKHAFLIRRYWNRNH